MTTANLEVNQLYESNIIQKNEIPLMIGWLPKHPLKIIKLYDTQIDTHNAGAFHQKCDDKGTTIVLVKTSSNIRFGGYTSKSWGSSSGAYVGDTSAFLFSLDSKKNILSILQIMQYIVMQLMVLLSEMGMIYI